MESRPAPLIDPPPNRLSAIPDALRALGDERALEAWWEATCTGATPEQIAGRTEAMAELIERDPEAALEDMRAYLADQQTAALFAEYEDNPLPLDWLADFAARCSKRAGCPSDAQSFWLLADQLKLRCERKLDSRVERLNLAADLQQPLDTHLSPRLIAELARAGAEGMDLLETRIEQLVEAHVKAALLKRSA